MPYQAGKDKNIKFTVAGGSEITYDITEHSWKEMIDALDITNTSHAGIQALLAGIFRGDGKFKAVLNTDATKMPWQSANGLRAGNNGVVKFYVGTALFYSVPCMVVDAEITSQVAGKVEWAVSVKLNAEAGTYSYPS